ncbi:MAG: hypothetical protein AAB853_02750 [Patescibacteria group bacterium]
MAAALAGCSTDHPKGPETVGSVSAASEEATSKKLEAMAGKVRQVTIGLLDQQTAALDAIVAEHDELMSRSAVGGRLVNDQGDYVTLESSKGALFRMGKGEYESRRKMDEESGVNDKTRQLAKAMVEQVEVVRGIVDMLRNEPGDNPESAKSTK